MLDEFLTSVDIEVSPREVEWQEGGVDGAYVEIKAAEYYTQTVLSPRPVDTKTQDDLDRVIALGKPQSVVDKFTALVNLNNSWDWCYEYIYYLNDKFDYDNWEVIVTYDDDGVEVSRTEQPPEPLVPVRGADITNNYTRKAFKASRSEAVSNITVDVDGLVFDGDEDSQNRMLRAITVLVGKEEMPWTLADNSVVYVTQTTIKKALTLSGKAQSELWQQ